MNMPKPTLIGLAAFVKRRVPAMRNCPRDLLLKVLQWYWNDGRVGILQVDGRIVAAALVRAVDTTDEAEADRYFHKEEGRLIWVDDIASTHPLGIPELLKMAMRRFGPRDAFAGHVLNRAGELRMLPWKTVERLTEASENGLTLYSSAPAGAKPS